MQISDWLQLMFPSINEVFYFGVDFAPIIDPKKYDTSLKRFGFVLSVMRSAQEKTQKTLEQLIFPNSGRNGSTISDWETGKSQPSIEDLSGIVKVLKLDTYDERYLRSLLFANSSDGEDLSEDDLSEVRDRFSHFKDPSNDAFKLPAYAVDHYWKILDNNESVKKYLNIQHRDMTGQTVLDLVFNTEYALSKTLGGAERWRELALAQLWRFRSVTSPLRYQQKYIDYVHKMASDDAHSFLQLWYVKPPHRASLSQNFQFTLKPNPITELTVTVKMDTIEFGGDKKAYIIHWEPAS